MKRKKILIVNKFLYMRGGDCICTLNLRKLLESNGYDVRFFAMSYAHNLPFPEQDYFAEEINFSIGGSSNKVKAIKRVLYGTGVIKSFLKLLDDFQPDIVHLNNIHSYISPIVAKLAHEKGIKVVWTLHDYKLICPTYSCLCHGKICESCFSNKVNALVRKCMKNSILASALAYLEALRWNKKKLSRWTDTFICPSQFMAQKMNQGGFPKEKLKVLCNFIDEEKTNLISTIENKEREKAYCYVGRLSAEKGVEELLSVATLLPYKLYIVGSGPQEEELRNRYGTVSNIHFLGHQEYKQIIVLLKRVYFSVTPSVCYENNPLSIIESLCCGTPVLGAKIGGIPELLNDGYSDLFGFKDLSELRYKIIEMFDKCKTVDKESLSLKSLKRFSAEEYYKYITDIYKK